MVLSIKYAQNYKLAIFMSIYVIGINHKTAPVTVREKVYFAVDKLSLYLQDLLKGNYAHEAVLISTCNRSELYCEAEDLNAIRDWFCAQTTVSRQDLEPILYILKDEDAVAHIMQVACGLDSMVLGEPQILGQMKEAFSESCAADTIGPLFHKLFQQIFSVAKEIRTVTAIGACPVSVATAAVHFAKTQFAAFADAKVVFIGAGDTTELLLLYLKACLRNPITIVNRSVENAQTLAAEHGAKVYGLDQLAVAIADADIVFSATGSALPILQKATVAQAMQERSDRSMMLIDIAVPRDIDPAVAEVANVKLFCIDDLKAIIEKHKQGREHAADKAREMIKKRSLMIVAELKSFDKVAHTIRAYRGVIEEICQAELLKAKQQLHQGMDAHQVIEMFARAFTQKLLHEPSVQLRQAGAEGRFEVLRLAKQLFALPDLEIERT